MKIHEPAMTFRSDSAKAEWAEWLENQKDCFGRSVFRFASEFATRAERMMAEDPSRHIFGIFKQAGRDANDESISGSMFEFASGILKCTWIHGDEFSKWKDSL